MLEWCFFPIRIEYCTHFDVVVLNYVFSHELTVQWTEYYNQSGRVLSITASFDPLSGLRLPLSSPACRFCAPEINLGIVRTTLKLQFSSWYSSKKWGIYIGGISEESWDCGFPAASWKDETPLQQGMSPWLLRNSGTECNTQREQQNSSWCFWVCPSCDQAFSFDLVHWFNYIHANVTCGKGQTIQFLECGRVKFQYSLPFLFGWGLAKVAAISRGDPDHGFKRWVPELALVHSIFFWSETVVELVLSRKVE